MGCRSDYATPSQREVDRKKAAGHLVWLCGKAKLEAPAWAQKDAESDYPSTDRAVVELCARLKAMDREARELLLYGDAHDAKARALADWWEKHEKADADRVRLEATAREKAALVERAKKKLTPEEWEAVNKK